MMSLFLVKLELSPLYATNATFIHFMEVKCKHLYRSCSCAPTQKGPNSSLLRKWDPIVVLQEQKISVCTSIFKVHTAFLIAGFVLVILPTLVH